VEIIDIKWGNQTPVTTTPTYLPGMYENLLFLSFALLRDKISGDIVITLSDGSKIEIKNEDICISEDDFLHQMFARKRIVDLTEIESEGSEDLDIRKGITDLAMKYNLLSKYTTYFIMDKQHMSDHERPNKQYYQRPVAMCLEARVGSYMDKQPTRTSDMLFIDISELSLGVGTMADGVTISEDDSENVRMLNVINKNTAIPTIRSVEMRANLKEKDEIIMRFYEGERLFCRDNLGFQKNDLVLSNLPKNRDLKILACVTVDALNKAHVHAEVYDKETGEFFYRSQTLILRKIYEKLDHEFVRRMEDEADSKFDADLKQLNALRSKRNSQSTSKE